MFALALALAGFCSVSSASFAQSGITLSGSYSHSFNGTGYQALNSGSPYTVTPTAAFFDNSNTGLFLDSSAATITGANFYNNTTGDGLFAGDSTLTTTGANYFGNGSTGLGAISSVLTVNSGNFSNNGGDGLYAESSVMTINSGQFSNNGAYGVGAFSSEKATLNGGTFGGNALSDLYVDQSSLVVIYGSGFTYNGQNNYFGALNAGSGSFSGLLENNVASETITFENLNGSRIVLAPVPEASTTVSFGLLLALGAGGIVVAARRRKAVPGL